MEIAFSLSTLGLMEFPKNSEVLKSAYKKSISKWHPDKFIVDSEILAATEKSKEINIAYEVLSECLEDASYSCAIKSYTPKHTYEGKDFQPGLPDENAFEFFVKSSNIISIGYNYLDRILYVKFHSNAVYAYFDVPTSVFNDFMKTASPGRFRNQFVNSFTYIRCEKSNVPYRRVALSSVSTLSLRGA